MGLRGRIGDTQSTLKLKGAFKASRHAGRSKDAKSIGLSFVPAKVPEWLQSVVDAGAIPFWDSVLSGLNSGQRVCDLDVPAFAMLASAWKNIRACDEQLAKDGFVVPGARGVLHEHPVCKIRSRYVQEFLALCEAFGLTPRARRRLGVNLEPPKESKLDKFRNAQ